MKKEEITKNVVGMYGGKFLPFHKGHLYCVMQALKECDSLELVMAINSKEEERIGKTPYSIDFRKNQIMRVAEMFPGRIHPVVVDFAKCRDDNGEEDWDKETPIVLASTNHFDIVYGSEKEYEYWFKRAYPWAEYHLIDEERTSVPVSATKIRSMDQKEAEKWII